MKYLLVGILMSCGGTYTMSTAPSAVDLINAFNQILACKELPQMGTLTVTQQNLIMTNCSAADRVALGNRTTCLIGSVCNKNSQMCFIANISASCQTTLEQFKIALPAGNTITLNNLDVDS